MTSKAKRNLSTGFFKETLFIQIALVVVFIIVLGFFNWSLDILKPQGGQYASLILNDNGNKRMFEGEVVQGMTILDALNASTLAGNIELRYRLHVDGRAEINQINGYYGEGKRAYFYINNLEVKTEDVAKVEVKKGDRIEVVLR